MSGVIVSTVGIPTVLAAGQLGYSISKDVSATHARNAEKHLLAVEKDRINKEQRTMAEKARAEADAKLAQRRSRSGRSASVATSPLGVTDAAPISQASLQGRSLLG